MSNDAADGCPVWVRLKPSENLRRMTALGFLSEHRRITA